MTPSQDVPIVGTVGNVNSIKGYKYLVEAIRKVVGQYGDIAVPIVGSKLDSQQKHLAKLEQRCSEIGIDECVQFVGWRSDIPQLLLIFDIFVLSSLSESGPMVVLEAMAMNCPVVMTNVGLIPEQFTNEEHGWIVEPANPDALSAAILDALERPDERERRATLAKKRVRDTLSLTAAADRHENLYRSLGSK